MPSPRPSRRPLTRRTALGAATAAGATLAAGCTADGPAARRRPGRTVTPHPDPDVALAAAVLAHEQQLLDLVETTLGRHPGLGALLGPARAAHRAHVRLLGDAAPDRPSDRPSPSASPATPSTAAPEKPVSHTRTGALRALVRAEQGLHAADAAGAVRARSGPFARVLASMAAAAAQQAAVLAGAAERPR